MPSFSEAHPLSPTQNVLNCLWLLIIGVPPLLFGYLFTHRCPTTLYSFNEQNADEVWWMPKLDAWENVCRFGAQHPLLTVNAVLFVCMDVAFWIANLVQNSTWLIDPYWTIIPLMIGQFYWSHPFANGHPIRAWAVMILLWVWSARLTFNYFRRENWSFGAREDWRFAELRRKFPGSWWWSSFFLAYVSQHLFLFGITLPLYPAFADPTPQHMGVTDWACLALSVFGVALAERADTVLRDFMLANERREAQGQQKVLLLKEGPWKYSRHPNYVGEQLQWWGLALLAVHQGHSWMALGAFLNSVCLGVATQMVEQRMLRQENRREVYKQYQREVDCWIPFSQPIAAVKAMLPGGEAPARAHRE